MRLLEFIRDIYETERKKKELSNLYVNTYYPKTLGTNLKKGEGK